MRKFLLALLVIAAVVIGGLWWLLSDANRFKPELIDLVSTNTGLQIAVDGNLGWRLWPPVQLVAEGVSADWSADAKQPLLQARSLRLDAELWSLIGKNPKLVIQGITVDGLRANLVQTGDHANWMPPGYHGALVPPVPIPPPAANPSAPWEVASLAINDALIDYSVDGKATKIDIDALHMSGIAPGKHFPLRAKLTVGNDQYEIPVTIAAQVTVDAAANEWQVDADADVGKITATLDLHATNLSTQPRFAGHIDLPQQRLDSIAMLFDTHISEPVGFKSEFIATEDRVDLRGLEARYGDAVVTGEFGSAIGARNQLDFDLKTDRFTIRSDGTPVATLGAGSFAAIAFAAPTTQVDPSLDEPLLPLELIRGNDWKGKLTVNELLYDGATFKDATIVSANTRGDVDTTIELPDFFGGSAVTHIKVDTRDTAPQWHVVPKLTNVDSTALLAWLEKPYDWVAVFLAGGELAMEGNTPRELTNTLSGHTTFDGGKGTLDITEIKRQALALAAIAGGTELVNAWPEHLKYQRLTGTWNTSGAAQDLDIVLDNLSLKAIGKLDALADDMDLTVTVTVNDDPKYKSFKVSPLLTGLPVPVRCRGSLDAPKCGADEAGTRKLLAQALSGSNPEMKKKLDQAIDEKVPAEYRDAARSLLELLNKGAQQTPSQQPAAP
jgi:AsmA protein